MHDTEEQDRPLQQCPTTPHTQPLPGIPRARFSPHPLSLATTHGITYCFLLLRVLRCFTSPRSPPRPIHSSAGNPTSLELGFPIRTSSDQRSVDNSPRHNAASHVLHRPLVPRHPPCALHNLATKMLASTIQFSNNTRQHTHKKGMPPENPTAHQQASSPNQKQQHQKQTATTRHQHQSVNQRIATKTSGAP
jgi:hypothetical protein